MFPSPGDSNVGMPAAIANAANVCRSAYGGRCSSPAALTAGVHSSRRQSCRFRWPPRAREQQRRIQPRRQRVEGVEARWRSGTALQRTCLLAVQLHLPVRVDAADVDEPALRSMSRRSSASHSSGRRPSARRRPAAATARARARPRRPPGRPTTRTPEPPAVSAPGSELCRRRSRRAASPGPRSSGPAGEPSWISHAERSGSCFRHAAISGTSAGHAGRSFQPPCPSSFGPSVA